MWFVCAFNPEGVAVRKAHSSRVDFRFSISSVGSSHNLGQGLSTNWGARLGKSKDLPRTRSAERRWICEEKVDCVVTPLRQKGTCSRSWLELRDSAPPTSHPARLVSRPFRSQHRDGAASAVLNAHEVDDKPERSRALTVSEALHTATLSGLKANPTVYPGSFDPGLTLRDPLRGSKNRRSCVS